MDYPQKKKSIVMNKLTNQVDISLTILNKQRKILQVDFYNQTNFFNGLSQEPN